MKLTDLEPRFMRIEAGPLWVDCDLEQADGLMLVCPKCFLASGMIGAHSVVLWRPRVAASVSPGPGRWEFSGTGLSDLTLTAGSSSISLGGGCRAHFYITNGQITWADAP